MTEHQSELIKLTHVKFTTAGTLHTTKNTP